MSYPITLGYTVQQREIQRAASNYADLSMHGVCCSQNSAQLHPGMKNTILSDVAVTHCTVPAGKHH